MSYQYECSECGEPFDTSNSLTNHKLTHLPETIPCLACTDRKFSTYFGMIIHLERGKCSSGMNLARLNKLAAQCFQWKKYLIKDWRVELLNADASYRDAGEEPFKCPRCEVELPMLSSLFQHVWSTSCSQGRNGGAIKKLRRWLAKSLYRYKH